MQRIGKFKLYTKIIEQEPWIATRIMSQCIIVRAEMIYSSKYPVVEYLAISRHFDENPEYSYAPEYKWLIYKDGSIKAFKIKEKSND